MIDVYPTTSHIFPCQFIFIFQSYMIHEQS